MMTSAEASDESWLVTFSRSRLENTDVPLPFAVPAQPLMSVEAITTMMTGSLKDEIRFLIFKKYFLNVFYTKSTVWKTIIGTHYK